MTDFKFNEIDVFRCHCGEVAASHGWNHFANHGVKFVHEGKKEMLLRFL